MENYGYLSAMKKYVQFSGRAPRKEYWMYILIYMIGIFILSFLDGALFGYTSETVTTGQSVSASINLNSPIFSGIFALIHFLPGLSVAVRRMHDIGRSGWWILIGLIPLIGIFFMIYWLAKRSEAGTNRFGDNPYNEVDPAIFGRGVAD